MKNGPRPRTGDSADAAPLLGAPAIVFHGDRDTTVHPVNGDELIAQARSDSVRRHADGAARGPDVTQGQVPGGRRFTRTVHRDAMGRPDAEHWLIHGAGHAWSGGSSTGSYTDPLGPDASREMLRFFAEHALR